MEGRTSTTPRDLDGSGLLCDVCPLTQRWLGVACNLLQGPSGFRRDNLRRSAGSDACLDFPWAERLQNDLLIVDEENLSRGPGIRLQPGLFLHPRPSTCGMGSSDGVVVPRRNGRALIGRSGLGVLGVRGERSGADKDCR